MPCSQRKARILLKEGKAVINKYNPFTIRLVYATGEAKQDCHIGVDTGSKHIGLAITSKDNLKYTYTSNPHKYCIFGTFGNDFERYVTL